MKKLLVVYVVWSNCNLVYGSTSHQRIQSKGIELVGVRSFLNGVSWNSCRAACVNPEWNSNEAPIDRNDLMIMNNDRVKEEEGAPTGFRINSYMQGGVGKAAGQCSCDGDWWWRGEAKEKPRENGSISIKGIKRKTKQKKKRKKKPRKSVTTWQCCQIRPPARLTCRIAFLHAPYPDVNDESRWQQSNRTDQSFSFSQCAVYI